MFLIGAVSKRPGWEQVAWAGTKIKVVSGNVRKGKGASLGLGRRLPQSRSGGMQPTTNSKTTGKKNGIKGKTNAPKRCH